MILRLVPKWPRQSAKFKHEKTIDILAKTIWGEARGEGVKGMQAVANVIQNRVQIAQYKGGYWWGNSIIDVCLKPYQFSCWNARDPNYPKLIKLTAKDNSFLLPLSIARKAVDNTLSDLSLGADHYHAIGIIPSWAEQNKITTRIDNHIFYKLVEV